MTNTKIAAYSVLCTLHTIIMFSTRYFVRAQQAWQMILAPAWNAEKADDGTLARLFVPKPNEVIVASSIHVRAGM